MSALLSRLGAALADRYRIERKLGAGGMGLEPAAESRGSAEVAEATTGLFKPDMVVQTRWTTSRWRMVQRQESAS